MPEKDSRISRKCKSGTYKTRSGFSNTLSKFLPRFSVMTAAACTLSYSSCRSSNSVTRRCLVFSVDDIFCPNVSTVSSASMRRAEILALLASSSSTLPSPSVSNLERQSCISADAFDRALSASDFFSDSSSIRSLIFSSYKINKKKSFTFSNSYSHYYYFNLAISIFTSVFRCLNLLNNEALSLASASPNFLVSSSWVANEILLFPKAAIAFSVSSICLCRS